MNKKGQIEWLNKTQIKQKTRKQESQKKGQPKKIDCPF